MDKSIKFEIHSLLSEGARPKILVRKKLFGHIFNPNGRLLAYKKTRKDITSLGSKCVISYDLKEWAPFKNIDNLIRNKKVSKKL